MTIINTHFPGVPVQPGVAAQVCYVLTSDDRGSHAVYMGIVAACADYEARTRAAQWVAERGTKLRYAAALTQFPGLPESKYRA